MRYVVVIGEDPKAYHTDDEELVKEYLKDEWTVVVDTEENMVLRCELPTYVLEDLPVIEQEAPDDDESDDIDR